MRAAVHRPGNVGWMMTGEEPRGDDSRGTKLERVQSKSGFILSLFVPYSIYEK